MTTVSGTRTYLEVKVGDRQCAEVLLFLRRQDLDWFNNQDELLFPELLQLLERTILPRMFGDELDDTQAGGDKSRIPPLGPGGIPIAEKNAEPTKKRKRMTKKAFAELKRAEEEAARQSRATTKEVYYAVGERLQLTYRLEQAKTTRTETLLFGNVGDEVNFRPLQKVSQRILVWCYPLTDSPSDPDPPGGGFPRPELIPISELFRPVVEDS
jgi:hypothetical protein